jgi:hypothetical protein
VHKADFEPSSHFVQILLVLCQNCLNQLDVNKQSLIMSHCSIVTVVVEQIKTNFFVFSISESKPVPITNSGGAISQDVSSKWPYFLLLILPLLSSST